MDDNNDFLSNYAKDKQQELAKTEKKYSYEQNSGFKKPKAVQTVSEKHGKKQYMGIAIAGAIIVIVAVILIIVLSKASVELPDFTNMPQTQAQLWAKENDVLLNIEQANSDEFAAERIISQDKQPGTHIGRGDFVGIVVSTGPDLSIKLPLPDIMSMTSSQIEAWAQQNFMSRVRMTFEFSDTVPSGNVVRFEVNDETVIDVVRRDSPVYIIVSKGAESETATITVPDFKTMSIADAYALATEKGFAIEIEEQYDDYIPEGTLISQSIKPSEKIKKGTNILLVLSKGKMVVVPSFKGHSKENAASVAASLGIAVAVTERYSGHSEGALISQSVAAGSVYGGEIIELSYSLGKKIFVPNFVGQTVDALVLWAQDLNKLGASINIDYGERTYSSMPVGTVLSQNKSNKLYGIKETVKVTVSKGKVVFVPDFAGSLIGDAMEQCEAVGLVPVFVKQHSEGKTRGTVWDQSIPPGTEESEGAVIKLFYQP